MIDPSRTRQRERIERPFSICRTNAGWLVTWHRFNDETTLHPTGHDAEQAAERIYGSPLAHLKGLAT